MKNTGIECIYASLRSFKDYMQERCDTVAEMLSTNECWFKMCRVSNQSSADRY